MQALLATLMILAGIGALLTLPPVRALLAPPAHAIWSALLRRARRVRSATVISSSGEEIEVPDAVQTEPLWLGQARFTLFSPRSRIIAVGLLVGALILWALPRLLPDTRADEFTVLIAPFREPNGDIGATGRAAAAELADVLATTHGQHIAVQQIDSPPDSAADASALLQATRADVLLWGDITPGGMLDGETLLPQLAYAPSGAYAPNSLDGYTGRFAVPVHYPLAAQPLNGRVVLPRLIRALADYSSGRYGAASTVLDDLERQYPALRPGLLRTLRATIWWARGNYEQSAGEFRRAIAAMPDATPAELARLYTSLGAVQYDMGDPVARESFNQAIALLQGQDLGELRYNLALEELRAGSPGAAATSLEQARRLLPPATAPLLALAEAYRLDGRLEPAATTLAAATRQSGADDVDAPFDLRFIVNARLRAGVQAERALLKLAQIVNARGSLIWELDVSPPLPEPELTALLNDVSLALRETITLSQEWNERAAAADAEQRLVDGSIATHQARRAELAARRNRFWLAVVEVELARLRRTRPPEGLAAIWFGLTRAWSPATDSLRQIETLEQVQPGNADLMLMRGRALLVNDNEREARVAFETAERLAPDRPEPLYHQAMLLLQQDRAQALQLLAAAQARHTDYFPARIRLAELAEEDGRWQEAIEQRRWLAEHRPGAGESLALARVLRLSGPTGYSEAEQALLPLVARNNAAAIIELSRVYYDAENIAAARSTLERGQQNTARGAAPFADISYELGQLLIASGDAAAAERQFEMAVNASPRHVPSHIALAQLATDERAAARHYAAALDAGANDPAILTHMGAMLLDLREYATAASAYERAISAAPDDADARYGAALAYLGLDRLDAAEEAARAALQRRAVYPEALVLLGDIALRRARIQEAEQQYRAALQQNSAMAAAYIGLGRVAATSDDWSIAAGHFLNAVQREPRSPEAHLWLGEARVRTGDLAGAVAVYQTALMLRDTFPEAHFGLAQAQFGLAQVDAALAEVTRALEQRPRYAEALLLLGKIEEQQGHDARALEAYGRAIGVNPRLAEPYYRRALVLVRADRLNDARTDLETATRLEPAFAEAHYWLGRVHFAQRNFQAAANRFREAVARRGGTYPEARFYQGMAEEQLGELNGAIRSFETVAGQNDDPLWAGEARAALARLSDR